MKDLGDGERSGGLYVRSGGGGGVNGDFGDEWMLLGWIGVLRLSVGFRGSIEILEVDGGLG